MTSQNVTWSTRRTSSYSGSNNACVEAAHGGQVVGIWDTKHRGSGPVVVSTRAWTAFLTRLK